MAKTKKIVRMQVAAGIISDRRGRVLIALREAGAYYGGFWEFPGGKIEKSESAEEALVRELEEELAVTVSHIYPWKTLVHAYPERRVTLHFFTCRIRHGELQPIECDALTWVRPEHLGRYPILPANRIILPDLKKYAYAEANGLEYDATR